MKEFFKSKKFKVLVCIFAVIFGFMIYVAVSAGAASAPQTFFEAVSRPFVSMATGVSNWINETIDKFSNADKYKQENEILRQQLSEMYEGYLIKEELEKENEQLKEMLGIEKENTDYQWSAPCIVTARNAGDIFGGFTINRGKNDGLALNDPVFTSIGLVGIISEISPSYSKVTTILSTELQIGARTVESGDIGVIENKLEYSADGYCVMSYVPVDNKIKIGEIVVTTGSNIFPKDIPIGQVKEIIKDDNGLSVHVIIEPLENPFKVSDVFAITDFYGQGEITE